MTTKCDFCSDPKPSWVFPARSFTTAGGNTSLGDWMACDICAGLIRAGEWPMLAQWSLRAPLLAQFAQVLGEAAAVEHAAALHRAFNANRTGPPYRAIIE